MTLENEIKEFVAETLTYFPEGSPLQSSEEQTKYYNEYSAAFTPPRPEGVTARDFDLTLGNAAVPVRLYNKEGSKKDTLILFFHGGGLSLGNPDTHDCFTAWLTGQTGLPLISVDYPLVPAHSLIEILSSVKLAWDAIQAQAADFGIDPKKVILCGDSAGGYICAILSQYLRDHGASIMPRGQVLIYPSLGHETTLPSHETEANAPLLTTADIKAYTSLIFGDATPPLIATPIYAEDKTGLPPTFNVPVEHDPLRDEAILYNDMLLEAGVESHLFIGKGIVHGCLRALYKSPNTMEMLDEIVKRIDSWTD